MTESSLPTTDARTETPSQPTDRASENLSARERTAIGVLLVSAFVVILNETIMGVAIPVLMVDLSIDAVAAQWLSTAFMLTMAVVIPITGYLLQRFNTRPIFLTAMSLFTAGTLLAAVAPGFEVLLGARVIQACGTAIMMPLLMTTVMTLVAPTHRGRVMGNISIVISVAPAIGPTISGVILSVLDWRWMFILVLPIAAAALIIGGLLIRNVTTPRRTPLDVLSVILSAFAFGGVVYGLSTLGEGAGGHTIVPGWLALVVGGVFMVLFVGRQLWLQKRDHALLDLRTFQSLNFTISIILMVTTTMTLFGTIILLPIYTQNVLQLTTLETGLMLLPGGILMGVLAPIVGRLYDRFGARVLLVPGATIVSVVMWGLAMVNESTPSWLVIVAHVALSLGLALMFTPLFTASLGSLTPNLYSHGSAIVGTVQQLAGASGTALFVAVMTSIAAMGAVNGEATLTAEADGVRAAFLIGACISVAAIALAFFVKKPEPTDGGHHPVGH